MFIHNEHPLTSSNSSFKGFESFHFLQAGANVTGEKDVKGKPNANLNHLLGFQLHN